MIKWIIKKYLLNPLELIFLEHFVKSMDFLEDKNKGKLKGDMKWEAMYEMANRLFELTKEENGKLKKELHETCRDVNFQELAEHLAFESFDSKYEDLSEWDQNDIKFTIAKILKKYSFINKPKEKSNADNSN